MKAESEYPPESILSIFEVLNYFFVKSAKKAEL